MHFRTAVEEVDKPAEFLVTEGHDVVRPTSKSILSRSMFCLVSSILGFHTVRQIQTKPLTYTDFFEFGDALICGAGRDERAVRLLMTHSTVCLGSSKVYWIML